MSAGVQETDWGAVLPSGEGFGQPRGGYGLRALMEMINEFLRWEESGNDV